MKVAILGAGSWGTALAIHLGRAGHDVLLWSRDPAVTAHIQAKRTHPRRMRETPLPAGVRATASLPEGLAHSETAVIAVPCASFRALFESMPERGLARRFLSTAKGIEPDTLRRMSEIILEYRPAASVAALSGPTFAEGVARGDPSAAVVADAGGGFARDLQAERQMREDLAREQAAEQERQMKEVAARQQLAARDRALAAWQGRIRAKIRGNIPTQVVQEVTGNPEAIFDVALLPTGEVLTVRMRKSSGNRAYDEAIERAILKSSPLPRPDQPSLFRRELELKFRPLDQ